MTTRFAYLDRIAYAMHRIDSGCMDGHKALHTCLLECLPPVHQKVYVLACEQERVTSGDLLGLYGMKQNMGGAVLQELHQWGLLDRRLEVDAVGRRFVYSRYAIDKE